MISLKNKKHLIIIAIFIAVFGFTAIYLIARPAESQATIPTEAPSSLYDDQRQSMVARAKISFNLKNPDVLRAMQEVPRHEFVPEDLLHLAYSDHPLPIGYGQTISAPYIVAWMTELLELQPGDRVLEIGTGSGYQAAVLAQLGYADVYSIEIVPELAQQAQQRINQLGYTELHLRQGDGYFGWEEFAPFDAIIVTAAPDHLPQPLVQQLTEGGRMIIPIGPVGGYQSMWKFINEGGELKAYNMGGVRFVPLVSEGEPQPMQIPAE
ncbi:MAG TPA: protein-L-isoaspartate(D-aspartate) O-methyltransferase [Anaerolineae bacterium]|nr:protein-L-isoaspartate(D-aspartate) O-methyltransferase [Anaerolineae bacterium]